jgi:cytochrome c-type biogenesis protein CcmE
MTPKRQRLAFVCAALIALGGASTLAFSALGDKAAFFRTPKDVLAHAVPVGEAFRLGGLVALGSVKTQGTTLHFTVTDHVGALPVVYEGLVPDLFREGQGVIAEGVLGQDGVFRAQNVLARHDETYMPPEVAKALKESGEWRPAPKAAPTLAPSSLTPASPTKPQSSLP